MAGDMGYIPHVDHVIKQGLFDLGLDLDVLTLGHLVTARLVLLLDRLAGPLIDHLLAQAMASRRTHSRGRSSSVPRVSGADRRIAPSRFRFHGSAPPSGSLPRPA